MAQNITRREALKRMGLIFGGAAINFTALSVLPSCTSEEKKRLVLYFTATGNCLYAARQFSDNTVSIAQAMKENNFEFEADEIGLVLPAYRCAPLEIVKRFLDKATLKAKYLFAVVTYGANHCNVVELLDERARKNGISFDYITTLKMVDNFLPAFDMNEQMKMDKDEDRQITKIKSDIDSQKKWHEPVTEEERQLRANFVKARGELFPVRSESLFTITDACIQCGFCLRVCPRGNYSMSPRIKTEGDCEYCLACIQNCPQKAIVLTAGERNPKARYRNPNVSINDIVRANNQSKI